MSTTPRPKLKIVCVCRGGNTRSVAMKMILNRYLGHSTLACGVQNNDEETLLHLFNWADWIVLTSASLDAGSGRFWWDKVVLFDLGDDVWGNPFDEQLQTLIAERLNAKPIFNFGRVIDCEKVVKTLRQYREKIAARNSGDSVV